MIALVRLSRSFHPVAYTINAAAAAEERYILSALSYTGNTLERASQDQAQAHAFDTNAADEVIAEHKKALADAAANGRKHIIDIGPKPVKFNPYTPFTLYRPGYGFEYFRDGKFKVHAHGVVLPMVEVPVTPPRW